LAHGVLHELGGPPKEEAPHVSEYESRDIKSRVPLLRRALFLSFRFVRAALHRVISVSAPVTAI
jgi:hypothetical protein